MDLSVLIGMFRFSVNSVKVPCFVNLPTPPGTEFKPGIPYSSHITFFNVRVRLPPSNRPGYPHPVCSELEMVVSEWRSVIAVSLNVGDGVRLIKPAKLCTCTHTLQTRRGRKHGAVCARPWLRTAAPLGERRYENWNTHTHNHMRYLTRVSLITPGHPRIPQNTEGYPRTLLISYIIHLFTHLFIHSDENKAKIAPNSFHSFSWIPF